MRCEIWVPGPLRPFIFTLAGDITTLDVRENVPHVCQTSESSPSKRRLLDQCGAHLQSHGIYIPFDSVPACAGDAEAEYCGDEEDKDRMSELGSSSASEAWNF